MSFQEQGFVGKVEKVTGGKGGGVVRVTVRFAIPLMHHDELHTWADRFVAVRPLMHSELVQEEAKAMRVVAAGEAS